MASPYFSLKLTHELRVRSMAQKESSHREIVDNLNTELAQVRRQHEELTVLARDQVCLHYPTIWVPTYDGI